MTLGIVIVKESPAGPFVALGDPRPYSEAKGDFVAVANDSGNVGKYAEVQLWTKDGIRKRRKLPAPVLSPESVAEVKKAPSKKAASKKAATK